MSIPSGPMVASKAISKGIARFGEAVIIYQGLEIELLIMKPTGFLSQGNLK